MTVSFYSFSIQQVAHLLDKMTKQSHQLNQRIPCCNLVSTKESCIFLLFRIIHLYSSTLYVVCVLDGTDCGQKLLMVNMRFRTFEVSASQVLKLIGIREAQGVRMVLNCLVFLFLLSIAHIYYNLYTFRMSQSVSEIFEIFC